MNEKEIAFIICVNSDAYYNECVRYIQELEVPDGYQTDLICIQEADSITEGYNAGMNASNAKYKVYLHQDTFIINKNFLKDILKIFQQDQKIGMIGVLGTDKSPLNEDYFSSWNIGRAYWFDGKKLVDYEFLRQPELGGYIPVKAVSGFLMVTQYDIPWREDILDGWAYYDVSQCMEMQKNGYQVVVPWQKEVWCYHDCGATNLKEYDHCKQNMAKAYPNFFEVKQKPEEAEKRHQDMEELEKVREYCIALINAGGNEKLARIVQELLFELQPCDTQIREIMNIMEIFWLEQESSVGKNSVWFDCRDWEKLREMYQWVCFVLRRIEWGRDDERASELKKLVQCGAISRDVIRKISSAILENTSVVYQSLLRDGMEEPLVSVVLPVYNGEAFIADTLESVLGQTYANIEVIVVDDASTDSSKKIISAYAQRDSRVIPVFQGKNYNVCVSSNIAFQMAKGKYIALIGHDDLWREDKLEKQVSFMEEHPSFVACFTYVDLINEIGESVNNGNDESQMLYQTFCVDNLSSWQRIRQMWLKKGNVFCAPSACVRCDTLKRAGYYRYGLVQLQDYDLWLRMLRLGEIYVLQEKLTLYRRFQAKERNLSSINKGTQNRHFHETHWILENYLDSLSEEEFIRIFKKDMRNPAAHGSKEIQCEKAFLSKDWCFSVKWFIDLLEDEECRRIMEENYDFTLNDFYVMNKEPLFFDREVLYKLCELQAAIIGNAE